jgi:hypothetical protein
MDCQLTLKNQPLQCSKTGLVFDETCCKCRGSMRTIKIIVDPDVVKDLRSLKASLFLFPAFNVPLIRLPTLFSKNPSLL